MSDELTRTQAAACLEKAGLSLTDAEVDQVRRFHSDEALVLLRGVEAARYEVPALGFDPVQSLRAWAEGDAASAAQQG